MWRCELLNTNAESRAGSRIEDKLEATSGSGLNASLVNLQVSGSGSSLPALFESVFGSLKPVLVSLVTVVLVMCCGLTTAHSRSVDSSMEKIVKARANDTFSTIAVREFGSVSMGRLIAEYNNMDFSSVLAGGFEIRIPTHNTPKKDFAEVVFTKGDATIYFAGSSSASLQAKRSQKIYANDRILTGKGGFVSLRFATGTVINVQPGSDVTVEQLRCLNDNPECEININAKDGGVQADVKRRNDQTNRFIIDTPYASAAVRGTVFDFDASSEQLLVGVTEGQVDIRAANQEIELPEGLGVKAVAGQGPDRPVTLLAGPRFSAVAPRISSEDVIAWAVNDKARQYMVSLTREAASFAENYRTRSADAEHQVQTVPAGDYFLNVRATDSEGFKGFTSSKALKVVDIEKDRRGPSLEIDTQNESVFVQLSDVPDTQETYEIQFSSLANFSDVVSVDVPYDGGAIAKFGEELFYARARIVVDESTVSRFGPVLEISGD